MGGQTLLSASGLECVFICVFVSVSEMRGMLGNWFIVPEGVNQVI